MISSKSKVLFAFGLLCSGVMGISLGLFYALQTFLIEKLWINPRDNLAMNAVMLVLIGTMILLVEHFFGQLPQNYGKIRLELREKGTAQYRFVLLQLVFPAFILISGTSLGPEATLVSTTLLYYTWLRDKLRYLDRNYNQIQGLSLWLKIRTLFSINKAVIRETSTSSAKIILSKLQKKLVTIVYFSHGVIWFCITFYLSGEDSLIIHIGESNYQPRAWIIMLPLLLFSYFLGQKLYQMMAGLKQTIAMKIQRPFFVVLLGGLAIFIAGILAPETLFSGQHNFHLFQNGFGNTSWWTLLLIAGGKLMLLTICKQTGWLGGDIFPVLFSSTIIGFVIAHFLGSVDQIFVVIIVAVGMGTAILGSPILVGSLMGILFAPVNLLPLVVVATVLLKIWQDYLAEWLARTRVGRIYRKVSWSSRIDNWN